MSIAQSMLTVIELIASQAIVNADSVKRWQNTHLVHRNLATLGMDKVIRQLVIAGHMQPHQLGSNSKTRFIKIADLGEIDARLNIGINLLQSFTTIQSVCIECPLR